MGGGASKSKSSQVAPAEENGAEKYRSIGEGAPDDLDNTSEYFFASHFIDFPKFFKHFETF